MGHRLGTPRPPRFSTLSGMLPTILLCLACASSPDSGDPADVKPTEAPAPQAPAPPEEAPAAPVDLASFAATAHDGTPRDISHLRGHPTVVWFYPKAATGG